MSIPNFEIARLPRVTFGSGQLKLVPPLARNYGQRALLVTGAKSFIESHHHESWAVAMRQSGMTWETFTVAGEPSPQLVDNAAIQFRDADIDIVIGIGGGSVLDAAKAIAGLLRIPNSVMDFLEGVGPELPYPGPSVPFIAVPTTAGTGSEATKNAVLSVQGPDGFKKSFRHEMLVPQHAILDPDLLATCPPAQIAANGMDALTQLLESYVSTKANPFTDALAMSGIRMVRDGATACWTGLMPRRARPMPGANCSMPPGFPASRWHKWGWVRYMGWQLLSVLSSLFRTASSAAHWSRLALR